MANLEPGQPASAGSHPVGAIKIDNEGPSSLQLAQIPSARDHQPNRRRRRTAPDGIIPSSWAAIGLDRPRLRSAVVKQENSPDIAPVDVHNENDLAIEVTSPTSEVECHPEERFVWTPASWHNDKQKKWMKLALELYNIDTVDVLMSEEEKRLSLSHLAGQGLPSRKGAITTNELKMLRGEKVFDTVAMMTALIRWNLRPPEAWTKYIVALECLECLFYLKECVDGERWYSERDMRIIRPEELSWNHHNRSWCSEEMRESSEVLVIEPLSIKPTKAAHICTFTGPNHPRIASMRNIIRQSTGITRTNRAAQSPENVQTCMKRIDGEEPPSAIQLMVV
ncbi:hypothetical protein COL26b_013514 [Colletotrichum chrysophilum]|uniref:uncharacterized protein n=1 Tax=Colletotrichum chrysophilum TaxID=1836956 RepID=UPI0022FFF089|nr:uncharacterized protein COL26b_013514 [Colletotrichum chrysophilum]KAJ0362039.1 hypothetical protein COL26b_013514 [Colletotrichum chrysophilum]